MSERDEREQMVERATEWASLNGLSGKALPVVTETMADFALEQVAAYKAEVNQAIDELYNAWPNMVAKEVGWCDSLDSLRQRLGGKE